jgi:hypothetical protein
MKYIPQNPRPLTPQDHPNCVVFVHAADPLVAFNKAAEILGPNEVQKRCAIWVPPDHLRDNIGLMRSRGNGVLRVFGPQWKSATFLSTNLEDEAGFDADYPHIDSYPVQHCIRSTQTHRGPGTVIYDGLLGEDDYQLNGSVITHKIDPTMGFPKLGRA